MIEKGSSQETEAKRHIRLMEGMLKVWNEEADRLRRAARAGSGPGGGDGIANLRQAERLQDRLDAALELTDRLVLDIAPGHELMMDLLRLNVALSALRDSVHHSSEQLSDTATHQREIAGLEILVDAVKASSARV
jgi:hypothetical protein